MIFVKTGERLKVARRTRVPRDINKVRTCYGAGRKTAEEYRKRSHLRPTLSWVHCAGYGSAPGAVRGTGRNPDVNQVWCCLHCLRRRPPLSGVSVDRRALLWHPIQRSDRTPGHKGRQVPTQCGGSVSASWWDAGQEPSDDLHLPFPQCSWLSLEAPAGETRRLIGEGAAFGPIQKNARRMASLGPPLKNSMAHESSFLRKPASLSCWRSFTLCFM